VNAARLLAGEPVALSAEQVLGPTGVDVRFAATMRFADGVLAHVDCALDQPRRDRLEVVGTDGALVLDDPWHGRDPSFVLRREFVVADVPVERGDPYRLELESFCDAVRRGGPPRWGVEDTVAQARTIEALRSVAALEAGPEIRSPNLSIG
jgi:xylose dehydrogenase (NAD/NADP)